MSVTMDEVNSKVEASEARTDAMFQRVLREMQEMRSDVQLTAARQRVWFMIMAVSIVISTVTIQEFLGTRDAPQAPIIVNVPPMVMQTPN